MALARDDTRRGIRMKTNPYLPTPLQIDPNPLDPKTKKIPESYFISLQRTNTQRVRAYGIFPQSPLEEGTT